MGGFIDRLALRLAVLVIGFGYFRLAAGSMWALALAMLLCILVSYLISKRWPLLPRTARTPLRLRLFNRARAPACAMYGALYMGLYLWLGQPIYLPLSLALLFMAGMGMHNDEGSSRSTK